MRPELIAASNAAHKAKEAELDEAEPELDRTLELGCISLTVLAGRAADIPRCLARLRRL